MTVSEPSTGRKQFFRWLGMASSLLFTVACFVPADPLHHYNALEDSWIQVLHFAFLKHLQFGREIVFTFGPWGFLYAGYQSGTHIISVLLWLGLAIIFWWTGRRVSQLAFQTELARWTWLMAAATLAGVTVSLFIEARLICFPLLLLALDYLDEEARLKGARMALLLALGLLSLVKFTVLILSAGILLFIAVNTIWRRRRVPWSLAGFAGSLLFFWLLAGQRLSSFGPYLRASWEITAGYTEAMMLSGPHEAEFVGGFILLGLLTCSSVALAVWKRTGFFAVIPIGALAFVIFNIFKYGFVRDDNHEAMAAVLLLLVSVICFAIVWPEVRVQSAWLKGGSFLAPAAVFVFAALSFHRFGESTFTMELARVWNPERWFSPVKLLYNGPQLRRSYQEFLANYSDQFPLPPLEGEADIYSLNQMELFANGLTYHPRPVFQSYSAYTPRLAELNVAHLRSQNAAGTVVLGGFRLDKRYSSLEDGLSWPELLTRYDVQRVELPFVIMKRSPTPRSYKLTLFREATVRFGEPVSLPPGTNGLVWAEIDVERTVAGSVVSTVFKPPLLQINTLLRSGHEWTNRFVPATARAGFLLSPFVIDWLAFVELASTQRPAELAGDEVAAFSIVPTGNFPPVNCYRNSIRVRLYQLDFPRQDFANVRGYIEAITLNRLAFRQKAQLVYLPEEGSIMAVPAESQIAFNRPEGVRHLRIGFGMYAPDGTQNTNGMTFGVLGVTKENQGIALWRRRINPVLVPGDRGRQEAVVDLGESGVSSVVLETVPDGTTRGDEVFRPYWFEIRAE